MYVMLSVNLIDIRMSRGYRNRKKHKRGNPALQTLNDRKSITWRIRQKKSALHMGFEPMTFCFTHISPLLTIESTNVQWLELPPRYEGLWVQIPAGTKIFFQVFCWYWGESWLHTLWDGKVSFGKRNLDIVLHNLLVQNISILHGSFIWFNSLSYLEMSF